MNKQLKAFIGIVSATPILFLLWMIVSFLAYLWIPFPIIVAVLGQNILIGIGAVLIFGGTVLSFAAQRISRVVTRPKYKATCPDLMQGPYRYSRHPGSLSLVIMSFGFAFVVNSLVMVILAGLIVILLATVFVPLEESVISELCPEAYAEYRAKVRMWI